MRICRLVWTELTWNQETNQDGRPSLCVPSLFGLISSSQLSSAAPPGVAHRSQDVYLYLLDMCSISRHQGESKRDSSLLYWYWTCLKPNPFLLLWLMPFAWQRALHFSDTARRISSQLHSFSYLQSNSYYLSSAYVHKNQISVGYYCLHCMHSNMASALVYFMEVSVDEGGLGAIFRSYVESAVCTFRSYHKFSCLMLLNVLCKAATLKHLQMRSFWVTKVFWYKNKRLWKLFKNCQRFY